MQKKGQNIPQYGFLRDGAVGGVHMYVSCEGWILNLYLEIAKFICIFCLHISIKSTITL